MADYGRRKQKPNQEAGRNDEWRMTKPERMTNDKIRKRAGYCPIANKGAIRCRAHLSTFVIRYSSFFFPVAGIIPGHYPASPPIALLLRRCHPLLLFILMKKGG